MWQCQTRDGREERGERREWQIKGNRIDYIRGERKEVELKHMVVTKEIEKLMKENGKESIEEEEEQLKQRGVYRGRVHLHESDWRIL